tara:strand:- start:621 stop:2216 length:1596 start_codon:yes stop_codon:yes gene_type:complete
VIIAQLVRINYVTPVQQELDKRSIRHKTIVRPRKSIVDRNGRLLAGNVIQHLVWIDPSQLDDDLSTIEKISNITILPVDKIQDKTQDKSRKYSILSDTVSLSEGDKYWIDSTAGIGYTDINKRHYPQGEITSQLIGIANRKQAGVEGLELYYDDYLQETVESFKFDRMDKSNSLQLNQPLHDNQSDDLVLSLDLDLQLPVYQMAKLSANKYGAESISILVLDSKTGEVLVNVNYPSYDPNQPITAYTIDHTNRIATNLYEPGSTIKPFAISPYLEDNTISPNSIIDIENGQKLIDDVQIKDVGIPQQQLTVSDVIRRSSNVGVVNITNLDHSDRLYEFYEQMGFGQPTGIGFPGEKSGLLSYLKFNSNLSKAFLSLGYGIEITMLQLAQSFMAVASGGFVVPLSYLKVTEPVPQKKVFSENLSNSLMDMLVDVVNNGTGRQARVAGYTMAGKTGTSQHLNAGEYIDEYTTSFAGFGPVGYSKQFVSVVVVRAPKAPYQLASKSAAPLFSEVMTHVIKHQQLQDHSTGESDE